MSPSLRCCSGPATGNGAPTASHNDESATLIMSYQSRFLKSATPTAAGSCWSMSKKMQSCKSSWGRRCGWGAGGTLPLASGQAGRQRTAACSSAAPSTTAMPRSRCEHADNLDPGRRRELCGAGACHALPARLVMTAHWRPWPRTKSSAVTLGNGTCGFRPSLDSSLCLIANKEPLCFGRHSFTETFCVMINR